MATDTKLKTQKYNVIQEKHYICHVHIMDITYKCTSRKRTQCTGQHTFALIFDNLCEAPCACSGLEVFQRRGGDVYTKALTPNPKIVSCRCRC